MTLMWRISLLIVISIIASSTGVLWVTEQQAQESNIKSEYIFTQAIVNSIREAIIEDVTNNNKTKVSQFLNRLKDKSIEYLYVTDANHNIFAHSFSSELPKVIKDSLKHHHGSGEISLSEMFILNGSLIHEYSARLTTNSEISIHIGMNQFLINQQLNKNRKFIFLVAILIILLSITIAFLVSRSMVLPLEEFIDQIHHFGIGKKFNFPNIKKLPIEIQRLYHAMHVASTERQEAINLALQREKGLSVTLNSIGDAVIATDNFGIINRMNPIAEKLTGWSSYEACGKPLSDVFPIINASTRKKINNPVDKVISTGQTVYMSNHTTLISKDGTEYQIADSAAPIRDKDDSIVGMVLVFNDVTEHYKLRQAANESKKNLQAIMDNSPAVIYVKNISGRFTFLNKQCIRLFGKEADAIIGSTIHDIFPDFIADQLSYNDQDVIAYEHALDSEETILFEGEYHTYTSTKFPLRDEQNEIYAICCISTDITEKKIKDEQLRRSQKMDALGKLTGGIAHDFNNMLGVVLGYSELLSQLLKDNPKLNNYVKEIHKAGERGAKLTNKLLSFSKQKATDATAHDINALLNEQKHMLETTLMARIKLEYVLSDNLWPVYLDSGDFEDAVVNMSINAMHAMNGNGQLTITSDNQSVDDLYAKQLQIKPGDYINISFTDTGRGMTKEVKDKIFDPFFTTKGDQGTGLGLSQVYGFMESCNGTINVYSELNYGTRVSLYFPRYFSENELQSQPTSTAFDEDFKGTEKILIVDDEPALLQLTSSILSSQGYQVQVADCGETALKILEKDNEIALMLTDVIMQEMDGYTLAGIVQDKYPNILIQVASGFSDDRHEGKINEQLHKNMLHKPYHTSTLLRRIRQLLDTRSNSKKVS